MRTNGTSHGRRARRGAALAEAVVAAVVLAVGVLAAVGTLAGATRDVARARQADRAVELLEERLTTWRAVPCAAAAATLADGALAAGERRVGGLHERWRVDSAGGLAVLADTVVADTAAGPGAGTPRVGVTAVAGCAP